MKVELTLVASQLEISAPTVEIRITKDALVHQYVLVLSGEPGKLELYRLLRRLSV